MPAIRYVSDAQEQEASEQKKQYLIDAAFSLQTADYECYT